MKIRAIVNGVCFYTTRAAIKKQTVSDFSLQNTAMYFVLDQMGKSESFGSTVTLYDGKMNRHSFDVQLNKCQ